MKNMFMILTVLFSLSAQAEGVPMLSDLDSLEWKNRIVVVYEPHNTDESLQLLEEQIAEIDDRDIIWFIIKGDLVQTNYPGRLSPDFVSNTRERVDPREVEVILIGKDGGIKSRSDNLDLEAVFSDIDAMPMRRFEMQN